MKKITLLFASISLFLTACSTNDTDLNNAPTNESAESQLKSYTLKRNADGSYYIDFDVKENTQIDTYKNADNTNDVVISKAEKNSTSKKGAEFAIDNNLLKVNILESSNGKKSYISVEDDGINLAGRGVTEFLYDYSITKNEDGTFTLDFEVNDNVTTDFVYDDVNEVYEIHLEKGTSKNKVFSRTLNASKSNSMLKIDFVNHKSMARTSEQITTKKPILIYGVLDDDSSSI